MAQFLLVSALVHTPPSFGSPFSANDVVDVYWDDSTESIVVKKNGVVWAGALGAYLGDLNNNFYVSGITSYDGDYAIAGYSFCDGSDLTWFRMLTSYPSYPYMQKRITVNSPVCDVGGGVVCDIHWDGPRTSTDSTSLTAPNGTMTSLAVSSHGPVKYALFDFDYATEGQLSGNFSGLAPGFYYLYAKDANDCTLWITFSILYVPATNEHYRATWKTLGMGQEPRQERLRIYEREYVGAVVDLDYGDQSIFKLAKPKQGEVNDKFFPIHPTNATISLTSVKDNQFLPLRTQDNQKYLVVYEVFENSAWAPIWQGYIGPPTWVEDFAPGIPHMVEIPVVDNVKYLEQVPFKNDNELVTGKMKIIKLIAFIMKKTGLSLKIRCGVNIFEKNHTNNEGSFADGSADPLDQTYIDTACYREDGEPFNCWDVLEKVLRPFGARIYQYENQWIIEEIDKATAPYEYRVFTADGVYESNDVSDHIIDIEDPNDTDRAVMTGNPPKSETVPAYGKITIKSNFNYLGSIVAGGFEKEDLLSPNSESFVIAQGIFFSEEGFRDWTLRLNGTKGVSFGRIVTSNRGDSSRTGLKTDKHEADRSVGAFFYDPRAWDGNLRDAYIESAEKSYQYGPNDDIKIFFEYSTPARPEYEFMVLRLMVKLGDQYLQPDLTWDDTEAIYRSYPSVSNSLQRFELTVAVPETTEIVDTTIQVRIYFYASGFYDYGLPTKTNNNADGTDGVSDLKAFITDGNKVDHRVDIRREVPIGPSFVGYFREFYELRYWDVAEDLNNGIIHPDDFDSDTNPQVWKGLKSIIITGDEVNMKRRGVDLKFYIDNVGVDSLPNGQPPPEDESIELNISEFINEEMSIELYNFDLPDIVNAKNMFNNYFQLEDGTPTSAWTRKGVNEQLKLQQILLKVLGANHSAPTYKLTGTFINEFQRMGINNYLRITKAGADLSLLNSGFAMDLSEWTGDASGQVFIWSSDNGGSAEVALSGTEDSEKRYQDVEQGGGYIQVSGQIHAIPSVGNDREDQLWLLFYRDGDIVYTEKILTFRAVQSEDDFNFTYKAFLPSDIDRVGFYFKRVSGIGDCVYQVGEFGVEGIDIEEIYQITDYLYDTRRNAGTFELMQLSKAYISLTGVAQGENNQNNDDDGTGNPFNGDFNEDFGGDFDTILN